MELTEIKTTWTAKKTANRTHNPQNGGNTHRYMSDRHKNLEFTKRKISLQKLNTKDINVPINK